MIHFLYLTVLLTVGVYAAITTIAFLRSREEINQLELDLRASEKKSNGRYRYIDQLEMRNKRLHRDLEKVRLDYQKLDEGRAEQDDNYGSIIASLEEQNSVYKQGIEIASEQIERLSEIVDNHLENCLPQLDELALIEAAKVRHPAGGRPSDVAYLELVPECGE